MSGLKEELITLAKSKGATNARVTTKERLEETNPTCCNCVLVCSGPREWRQKLVKLLHSSGEVIWQDDEEAVVNADTEQSQALLQTLKQEVPA